MSASDPINDLARLSEKFGVEPPAQTLEELFERLPQNAWLSQEKELTGLSALLQTLPPEERPKYYASAVKLAAGSLNKEAAAMMHIEELLEHLKPYPILLSIVFDTMTDEEFEQYVDSSPDEPEHVQ